MTVTVAICSRNRRASLLETLESLAVQGCDAAWEVLVVDNGSRDGTGRAVAARAPRFPVPLRVVREERRGLSAARNRALREAGEVCLFIDDDVDCEPGWLDALARAYGDAGVVGTGGPILPRLPPAAPAWWGELLPQELGGPTSRYDFGEDSRPILPGGSISLPMGANMGLRTSAARVHGSFRTDLGWGRGMVPSEELEYFGRLERAGEKLLYVGGARVQHRIAPERTSWRYYLRWQRGYGRAQVRMHPPPDARRRWRSIRTHGRRYRKLRRQAAAAPRESTSWRVAERERSREAGALLQLLGL